MEKTRKQLVATVAAMLGDQYKVSISIRHFEESLKEFDSTYFIEIVKKAAEDSLVPVIALDPFVKAVNQNEISMNRAASVIINTFFEFYCSLSIFRNWQIIYRMIFTFYS